MRCGRLHIGFAEKERDAGAGEHDRDTHRDVVHPREPAGQTVQPTEQGAGQHGRDDARPRVAGLVGSRVGHHGAEHQRALVAEIDPARLLGQAFAQADEQKRRAHPQRPGEQSNPHHAELLDHVASRGWNQAIRP